jgi:hypothetical protein
MLGALSAVNSTVTVGVNIHDAYRTAFFPALEVGLSRTLAATLAVYVFVRAIGWSLAALLVRGQGPHTAGRG